MYHYHGTLVIEKPICLRECAKILLLAEQTNCEIKFISKNKEGTNASIMSLLKLEMKPNDVVALFITSHNDDESNEQLALNSLHKILAKN